MKKRIAIAFVVAFGAIASAQTVAPGLYAALRWRHVGPFRGGRTVGAAGVVQQSNVFYIGVNNGGVWKTTDFSDSRLLTPTTDFFPVSFRRHRGRRDTRFCLGHSRNPFTDN